ncbi:MAG: transposase [Candidatus Villigracilaceae bacterium]
MSEREFFYRRLPHWHPQNATFFVTFRLDGSLPKLVIVQLQEEYEQEKRLLQATPLEQRNIMQYNAYNKAFARYDRALDQSDGPRWLADPQIAQIVQREIHALHPQNYCLLAYCIMPNHVHLLLSLEGILRPAKRKDGTQYSTLSQALWLLKGRTGHLCQKILGQHGRFWSRESYDHVVRNEREFIRILEYIVNNPVKAGLVSDWQDWPYTYVSPDLL